MSGSDEESKAPTTKRPLTTDRSLGALRHKALMLAMQSKHAEAGQALIDGLSADEREFSTLSAEEKRLATMAATYFSKAGDTERAARVYELLGEPQRAALSRSVPASKRLSGGEIAPRTSSPLISIQPASSALSIPVVAPATGPARDAALARAEAKQLVMNDRPLEAAELLASANLHYEAGLGFIKAGEGSRALSHLMLVAGGEPQYAVAAKTALRLLTKMGRCTSTFVAYLRPSIAQGPESEEEILVFQGWSELLIWRGYVAEARATVEAILEKYPKDTHSLVLRARLDDTARSATISITDEQNGSSPFSEPNGPASSPFTERSPEFGFPARGANSKISQAPLAPRLTGDRPSLRREPSANVRVSLIPPPGAPDRVVLRPGVVIGERFKLQAEIGRGGMATVFSAVDQELDEELAIKVFSGDLVTQDHLDDAVTRFREELKLCRKLNHPNIIQVYDIGIHGGHRYFTMELLRGQPLDEIAMSALEPKWVLAILIQVCHGLSVAHARGVIHRDIKPANLFVTNEGVLKIMDFGIAKSRENRKKTMIGTMAGTPAYMAPEQIMGFSSVGPAADQYSLGIVAYEMLTGNLPFYHEDMMPLLMMHREQAPEPLSLHVPSIDSDLEAAVLKMMAKLPEQRFATCDDAARHLDAILRRSA